MKITTLHFHVKELLMNVLVLFSEKKYPKNLAVTWRKERKGKKKLDKTQHEGCF